MLSYILRQSFDFERRHGFWPNMIYMNPDQYRQWQTEFEDPGAFDEISRRLAMTIVISVDALHPHVAWLPNRSRAIAG